MREQWLIEDRVPGAHIGYRAIVDAEGYTICEPSPMGKANARLIAAAPALLESLRELLECMDDEVPVFVLENPKVDACLERARSAINKATGGES
jgi:hypothetical protein